MKIGSLFSGIGGLELGLEMAGVGETIWQVEQSTDCQKVLARHWPNAKRYDDVRQVNSKILEPVDVMCGGFPCQDISSQNMKALGLAGSRSGLWFEYLRLISEMRPSLVIAENVEALVTRGLDTVNENLKELGCEVENYKIAACDVGAPHQRRRIFIVAYANKNDVRNTQNASKKRESNASANRSHSKSATPANRMVRDFYGFPARLDEPAREYEPKRVDTVRSKDFSRRFAMLGNSVVPQVAELLGKHLIDTLPMFQRR